MTVVTSEPEVPVPALRPYQRDGVAFLRQRAAALLADEMGLGKTVQVITALREAPEHRRTLLIVPAALRLNWERELERWAPELTVRRIEGKPTERLILYHLPVHIILATYEQVRSDVLALQNCTFDVVVLDEAQRIKNANSAAAFACKLLRRTISWALTGTPIENRIDDLLSLFEFLAPGLLRRKESISFVRAKIKPFILRRTKSAVATDLPPIIRQELRLQLTPQQVDAYDALWETRDVTPRTTAAYFRLITRLKAVCNFDRTTDASVKWDALRLILDAQTLPTHKVLVFSQYVATLDWLSDRIDHFPARLYHGGMSEQQRDAVLKWFDRTHGPSVLLISLRAGGVGLNLNAASTVVLFDRWWNPALEEQAIHRAHRLGRAAPLHVMTFLVENTIEERIKRILDRKAAIAGVITGTQPPIHPSLTLRDLEEILSIARPRQKENA